MTDIQSRVPEVRVPLTRVGVEGVKKLIKIPRKGKRPIILLLEISCFVDLPSNLKGIHMSRNLEAINEILEEAMKNSEHRIEELGEKITRKVLEKHEYANLCEVEIKTKYMIRLNNSQKFVKLFSNVIVDRRSKVEKTIGGELKEYLKNNKLATVSLEVELSKNKFLDAEEIIKALLEAVKSKNEEEVVRRLIKKCNKYKLKGIARCFVDYPDFTTYAESDNL